MKRESLPQRMERLLGLLSAYCWYCKQKRIVSETKPLFCLTCGHYIKEEVESEMTGFDGKEKQKAKQNLHKPIVEFGLVGGYDNPLVVKCRTVEADVRNKRSCKGQFCVYWERCGMRNRVIILKVLKEKERG